MMKAPVKMVDRSTIASIVLWVISLVLLAHSCAYPADYSRAAFRHWSDLDHDGLNTRQEEIQEGRIGGIVWVCPYTGEVFTDAGKMDVDHIVPISWAWRHGADRWTADRREQFANDPENLLLVAAAVNRAKGDKGPDQWLPTNLSFAGAYIHSFRAICHKYALSCDDLTLAALEARYQKINNGGIP